MSISPGLVTHCIVPGGALTSFRRAQALGYSKACTSATFGSLGAPPQSSPTSQGPSRSINAPIMSIQLRLSVHEAIFIHHAPRMCV